MGKLKKAFNSVRVRLFMTLSLVILLIIVFLILVNNFVFGQFYIYSKTKALKSVYEIVNNYYKGSQDIDLEVQLERLAINNNFDILIKNNQNVNVYTSNKDFFSTLGQMKEMTSRFNNNIGEVIENGKDFTIKKLKDSKNDITYILLSATLDNDYLLYIRIPITSIQESVKISNNFLYLMARICYFNSSRYCNLCFQKIWRPYCRTK